MLNEFKKQFSSCQDVNEIKKLYRGLALANHPDKGGDEEAMKMLNAAYFWALDDIARNPRRKASAFTEQEQREYKYNFNQELEQEVLDQFFKFWNFDGLTVEILGLWVWITGDTKTHKEEIKAQGFKFSSTKIAWYWHKGDYKGSRGKTDLDTIRDNYGIAKDNRDGKKTRYYPVKHEARA